MCVAMPPMLAMTAATKAQPSAAPFAGLTPETPETSANSAPPPPARFTDHMSRAKTAVPTMVDARRNGLRYFSGLNYMSGKHESMKIINAVKSPVVIVPFASSVLRLAYEGHRQVRKTLRHWPPYQVLVDVQTKDRNTRIAMGNKYPHVPHTCFIQYGKPMCQFAPG
jgi:hypothetical protein